MILVASSITLAHPTPLVCRRGLVHDINATSSVHGRRTHPGHEVGDETAVAKAVSIAAKKGQVIDVQSRTSCALQSPVHMLSVLLQMFCIKHARVTNTLNSVPARDTDAGSAVVSSTQHTSQSVNLRQAFIFSLCAFNNVEIDDSDNRI